MRHTAIATLALAAVGLIAPSTAGVAQSPPLLDNKQIEIAYIEPRKESHRPIYERLRKRAVLEELKQFLSPLRLPPGRKLLVKIETCAGGENNPVAAYQDGIVTLCYEYIEWIRLLAPSGTSPEGWRPEDAIVGPFVEIVFHGVAHAVFDLLEVPVWGRAEDAADNLGGFIMWQFGKDVARRTLTGVAHFHKARAVMRKELTKEDFADNYGTDWQRFYSFLCIAYGGAVNTGDYETFRSLAQESLLPKFRRERCQAEFAQVERAFQRHILPHVDQQLLKQVQAREWLRPDDGR